MNTIPSDQVLDLVAATRDEERDLIGAELNAEGYLALVGAALTEASAAMLERSLAPSTDARALAKKALARVAAAAAEGIAAIEREDTR